MDLRVDLRGGGADDDVFPMLVDAWISGLPRRSEILGPVRELVCGPAPPIEDDEVRMAAGPILDVLEMGMDGIPVTASGTFRVATARRMADAHPGWAGAGGERVIRREADLPMLRNIRHVLHDCGFMYVREGMAFTEDQAASMRKEAPAPLLMMCGCEVLRDHGVATYTAELCAAAMLAGVPPDLDALAEHVHPAVAEYWQFGEEGAAIETVRLAVGLWLEYATSIGVLPDPYLPELRSAGSQWPREVGSVARASMVAILRFRTIASGFPEAVVP